MSHGCAEHTRAELLRAAAAQAGKGLPSIERGMPEPAGTGLSRRSFLSRSAGLALAVYGAGKLPLAGFDDGIAQAAQPDRILVSIFFDGGMDSLNVLAPVTNDRYRKLRPTLRLDPDRTLPFQGSTELRWHPAASKLARLHDEGKVTVFPAIGYSHADQSHFT